MDVNTDITRTLNAGENHFYRITLPNAGLLTVSTEGTTDTLGILFGPDGIEETRDSSNGGGGNFLISSTLAAGIYCVAVQGQFASTLGTYRLFVEGDFINPPATCNALESRFTGQRVMM